MIFTQVGERRNRTLIIALFLCCVVLVVSVGAFRIYKYAISSPKKPTSSSSSSTADNDQVTPDVSPTKDVDIVADTPSSSSEGSSVDDYIGSPSASQVDCNAADATFTAHFTALLQTPTVEAAEAAEEAYGNAKFHCAFSTAARTGIDGNPTSFKAFYSKNYKEWQDKFISFYVRRIANMNPEDLKKYDFSTPFGSLANSKTDMIALLRKEVEAAWEAFMSTPSDDTLKQNAIKMTGNLQILEATTFSMDFEGIFISKLQPIVKTCFVQADEANYKIHLSQVLTAIQAASPYLSKSAQEIIKSVVKRIIDEDYYHPLLRQLKREKPFKDLTAAKGDSSTWDTMLPEPREATIGPQVYIKGVLYHNELPLTSDEVTAKFNEFKTLAGRITLEYKPDGFLTHLRLETAKSSTKTYVEYFKFLMDNLFDENNKACIIHAQDLHAILKPLVKEVHYFPLSGHYALSRLRKLNESNSELSESEISKLKIYLLVLDGLAHLSIYLKKWSAKTTPNGAFYLDVIRADPAILKAYSEHFKNPATPKPSDSALDKYLASTNSHDVVGRVASSIN